MARSHSIYLVYRNDDILMGCFTVKHEAISFVKNLPPAIYTIERTPDGRGYVPSVVMHAEITLDKD